VTSIDEHAETRGLIPAIIEGTCDRLRPVLLTTLTTVLGLAPLLFERSTQAQFLKPTVITLVYGLGFGMLLVLLVVPALLAIGRDLSHPVTALRRGLRVRRAGLRATLGTGAAMVLGWFGATMGWTLVTGALPAPFATLLPLAPLMAALALFVTGAALLLMLIYLASTFRRRAA
jgi:hypothetical protein